MTFQKGGKEEIRDTSEGKVTMMLRLMFKYLMTELTILSTFVNHGTII